MKRRGASWVDVVEAYQRGHCLGTDSEEEGFPAGKSPLEAGGEPWRRGRGRPPVMAESRADPAGWLGN